LRPTSLVQHRKRFDFSALLGDTFTPDEVDNAIEAMRSGALKPVIAPHGR
jgi:hypothetical protein